MGKHCLVISQKSDGDYVVSVGREAQELQTRSEVSEYMKSLDTKILERMPIFMFLDREDDLIFWGLRNQIVKERHES